MQLTTIAFCTSLLIIAQAAPNPLQIALSVDIKNGIAGPEPYCLLVCWEETPQCPDKWYSNNKGTKYDPCWTCCLAPSKVAVEGTRRIEPTTMTEDSRAMGPAKEKSQLPKANDLSVAININDKPVSAGNIEDMCWPVCWPREPYCPAPLYSNNKGNADEPCWTCCNPQDSRPIGMHA